MPRNDVLTKAQEAIERALEAATDIRAKCRIKEVQLFCGYAEPGYSDPESGVIALGNWNGISDWKDGKCVPVDDAPGKLAKELEGLGVELEWSDEWVECQECLKIVRTKGDSYQWKGSYWISRDGEFLCPDCALKDPEAVLRSYEGEAGKCLTLGLDPSQHGYRMLKEGFENGLHGGQAADPKLIAKALREQGVERFLFVLDNVGQFDINFSVWVHEDEIGSLDKDRFEQAKTDGVDPAEMARKGLQAAHMGPPPGGQGVVVNHIDLGDGSVKTEVLSPQEFAEGKAGK